MKRAALLATFGLTASLLMALAGCGQTGPLYLPTPEQRGVPRPVQPVTGDAPPSDLMRSRDDAQMQQPTPNVVEPRPGTR